MDVNQMKQLAKAYFVEAKWFNENYVPTVEEYMETAMVSSGYCLLTVTSFLGLGDIATEEAFEWASTYPKIVRASSVICRLMDDIVSHKVYIDMNAKTPMLMATNMSHLYPQKILFSAAFRFCLQFEQKRGHPPSSVECYVKQYDATEEEAYAKFRTQIVESWKDMNEECLEPRDVPMPLLMCVVNIARVMDALYEDEDHYTHAGGLMKDLIKSLFIDPVPI